jgi:hypothetical protein
MGLRGTLAAMTLLAGMITHDAQANGLEELKSALAGLQGASPVRASLVAQVSTNARDDDGRVRNASGTAMVSAEDGPQGLLLSYPRDIMRRAVEEGTARQSDAGAPIPTRNALNELDYSDVTLMLNAGDALLARLKGAKLKSERSEAWNNMPARALTIELAVPKNQQFVDKQSATLEIWIGADGRPLASRTVNTSKGSAFVVVSFETRSREDRVYAVSGDRLLIVRRETSSSGSGVGQRGETKATVTLQLN